MDSAGGQQTLGGSTTGRGTNQAQTEDERGMNGDGRGRRRGRTGTKAGKCRVAGEPETDA